MTEAKTKTKRRSTGMVDGGHLYFALKEAERLELAAQSRGLPATAWVAELLAPMLADDNQGLVWALLALSPEAAERARAVATSQGMSLLDFLDYLLNDAVER